MELFTKLNDYLEILLSNLGHFGPIFCCILIIFESILPILPLCVFITLIYVAYGHLLGFFISWAFTVIGCYISFTLFRKGFRKMFVKKIRKINKVDSLMKKIDTLKFNSLVLLAANPFFPAFALNIAAALSNMEFKKYAVTTFIGKIFMVYFWGYVGSNFVESLKNPIILVKIIVISLIAYAVGRIVNKKLGLD